MPSDDHLRTLLERLTLERKVLLLTGRDMWSTWPLPEIGLRAMVLSDGPAGVRGPVWDERDPSLNLPSGTALAASWDVHVAHRYGEVLADEARRKGVDVVLGPTINLHRSPLGGRHFEAFSEDPLLTGTLAAAYVRGLQENGVAASPKHYVANDFETDRRTVDVRVDERTLREVYLRAFEIPVVEGGAWTVMSAYNSVNGVTASANDLLETPLCSEWGFDGVVVSDWTAVRSLDAAHAAQDLVMPGPDGPWGAALVAAVRDGSVLEATVDRKVLRLLRLAARVGALEPADGDDVHSADGAPDARSAGRVDPPADAATTAATAFAREASAEGMVLVRNALELPWRSAPASVAVLGHNAAVARTQGGGSATVVPGRVVSPLDGLREHLGDDRVRYAVGAVVHDGLTELEPAALTNPVTGEQGVRVTFHGHGDDVLLAEDRYRSSLVYLGGDAPLPRTRQVDLETRYVPSRSGAVRIGIGCVGRVRIHLDGVLVHEETSFREGIELGAGLLSPPSVVSAPVVLEAGRAVDLRVEVVVEEFNAAVSHGLVLRLGSEEVDDDPEARIAEAVELARQSEVAVVVVGTNARIESEGHDRTSLALPGRQDDLVRAVAAVNPRTVVVVNAGAPVLMPWRDDVAAVLLTYFGGQEYGSALADVLLGDREPGGRLPTTLPAREEDVPVLDVTPRDGRVEYAEGVHLGHRAWLRAGVTPAYPFGHGLGYTTWELAGLRDLGPADDDAAVLEVELRNSGGRAGKQVVQVYAERPGSAVDRPASWLVAFAAVRCGAGEVVSVRLPVPRRELAHWADGWVVEPGEYTLRVGTSATEVPLGTTCVVEA